MAFSVNATAAAALLLATSFFAVPAVSQQLEMPSNEAIQKIMQEQAASRSAALSGKIDPVKAGTFKTTVPVIDAPAPTKTESLDDVIARFNAAKTVPRVAWRERLHHLRVVLDAQGQA